MVDVLNLEDLFSIFYIVAFWFQPVFWMWFYEVRGERLNGLFFTFFIYAAVVGVSFFIPQVVEVYAQYPALFLIAFYSMLGVGFAAVLQGWYRWGFPQALSVGALTVFVGSYLWEVPYLLRNASATGLFDWALHLFGLLIVWFLAVKVGWLREFRAVYWLTLSLAVSFICMVVYPISGPVAPTLWNMPLYMFNRGVACVVSFILLKKEINK